MDNPETIIRNDDWTSVYNPVQYEANEPFVEEPYKEKKTKKSQSKPLLTLIQIFICVIAVLLFYSLKTFDNNLYNKIYDMYRENLNNEIVLTETFEDFSLDNIINAVKNK